MLLQNNISNRISRGICNHISRHITERSVDEYTNQTQASAFDDVWGWYRADSISGTSTAMTFNDLSGNGRHAVQTAGTLTAGTATNGQAKVTGNSTATLTCGSDAISGWPMTVITVAKRTALATVGFFGASGASSFNKYWYGFETTDRFALYNTSGILVTAAGEAGQYAAFMHRGGYGVSVGAINGNIKVPNQASSVLRSATTAVPSIGTTYRGLNCDWQETLVWNRNLSFAELDEVQTYLAARYGLTFTGWTTGTAAPTVTQSGQSNSAGRGVRPAGTDANVPVDVRGAITGANVFHGISAANTNGGTGTAFETLNINAAKSGYTGNHMLGDNYTQPTNYFGPELTMCRDYLAAHGGSIYLVKYAVGGTPLAYNAAQSSWHIGDSFVQSHGNRLWTTFMHNWWASMVVHQAAGRSPDLKAIIWYQGEQDAVNSAKAAAYETNLTEFLTNFGAELGFPNVKVLLCRLNQYCPETYFTTVRAAQESVIAAMDTVQLVDTDNFEIIAGDPVHLSYNGQIALGSYLATQL